MVQNPKNNVFIKMTKAEVHKLDVLCSIHGKSRPAIISALLDRAWKAAYDSGKLEEWLQSLSDDSVQDEETPAKTG